MRILSIIVFSIISFNFLSERSIHNRWSIELLKFVDENGQVDYVNWSKNRVGLDAYISALKKNHPKPHWTKNQIMSYWINAYNALTIKIILDNYPVSSIKEIKNPWSKKIINYDSNTYSLDDIEHSILRKMGDPRIHFAINCASISCPKLLNTAYLPHKIDYQLDKAASYFINNTDKNKITKNEVIISKIFFWFKKDFGNKNQLLNFINKYKKLKNPNPKIKYHSYNWNLNIIQ